MARKAKGEDSFGYRAEFIQLVEKAELLKPAVDTSLKTIGAGPKMNLGPATPPRSTTVCNGPGCGGHGFDKKKINIKVGTIHVVAGETDALKPITKYVKTRMGAFRNCYHMVLKKNPGVAGKIVIEFELQSDGKPAKIKFIQNTINNDKLWLCLKSRIARWRFPKPGEETLTIQLPMFFRYI